MYHSLVSSHINYCDIVWGFTTKQNLDRICKLQKRAVRLITHSPFSSPSKPLFFKMHNFYTTNSGTKLTLGFEGSKLLRTKLN